MLPYKNLLLIDRESPVAVFRQLAQQFIKLIQEGKLLPGTPLPSTRNLAFDLGLHRKTVVAAYNNLIAEDWLESLPRKGYIVSPRLPVVKPRSYQQQRELSFTTEPGFAYQSFADVRLGPAEARARGSLLIDDGFPDLSLLPRDAILKEYRRAIDYPVLQQLNSRWEPAGGPVFREAMAGILQQTRGLDIHVENLLTTRGAQMAIYLAAARIIQPGDKVLVGDPGYPFADRLFEQFGAELIRVPVDEQGMQIDRVAELLQQQTIKLLYVVPHHHHPTTATLSAARREQLLTLIADYPLAVIEDDYDYDFQFQYDPYLPLASGQHGGKIIYIGSVTKVLGTPFRLGYLVASAGFVQAASNHRALIDLRGDIVLERIVAGLIQQGELTRLIQKGNKLYKKRCQYAADALRQQLGDWVDFTEPSGGMALWLRFADDFLLQPALQKAAAKGLHIMGQSQWLAKGRTPINAFRFGFASLAEQELDRAVEILADACRSV